MFPPFQNAHLNFMIDAVFQWTQFLLTLSHNPSSSSPSSPSPSSCPSSSSSSSSQSSSMQIPSPNSMACERFPLPFDVDMYLQISKILEKIERDTFIKYQSKAHMITGKEQGLFLSLLSGMMKGKRVENSKSKTNQITREICGICDIPMIRNDTSFKPSNVTKFHFLFQIRSNFHTTNSTCTINMKR